jgi:hypothetical protein
MIKLAIQRLSNLADSFTVPFGVIPKALDIKALIGDAILSAKFVFEASIANVVDSILSGHTRESKRKPGMNVSIVMALARAVSEPTKA